MNMSTRKLCAITQMKVKYIDKSDIANFFTRVFYRFYFIKMVADHRNVFNFVKHLVCNLLKCFILKKKLSLSVHSKIIFIQFKYTECDYLT